MLLTDQQVKKYANEGFLSPLPVADASVANNWREQFDEIERSEGKEKSQVGLHDRHFDQKFIWEIATSARILDAVESIIGPNVMLLASQFFCKYGQGTKFVAWHQDVTYWGLEPPEAITAWCAIDRSDHENGCMMAIPGSHSNGIHEHGKAETEGNLLSINQEVPVTTEDEARSQDIVLEAGEMSLHHGMLVHSSQPNVSSRRRCGLVMRYTVPSVRQERPNSIGARYRAILVRGTDDHQHYGNSPTPTF